MNDLLLTAAIAFFVTIDPVGLGPVFAGLTGGMEGRQRRRMAIKGTLIGAAILLTFAFVGEALLHGLGISTAAFRIAGGILLLLLAIDLVFARESGLRTTTEDENVEARHRPDISVFPLAIPLIAGPGAMTSIVLFMGRAGGDWALQAAVLGVLLAVLAGTLLVLLFAGEVSRVLGRTGINVINRVLGILLTALACQFVIDGVVESGILNGA
ncbi:MarC family protein [Indioceanicola profundi]|uniref:MarC family protein n=1 Tax=Indioceanicola profundi TaxID=2220096 RepID=UPI000E6ABECD|nr:MarC family protein [Indioceanicola profundi]